MQIKKFLFLTVLFIFSHSIFAQQNIKNVIILIPDGTSADIITLSRWYQNNQALAVDEIICGLVKTHSVENKITDSAPSSTAYATGEKTKSGYIGVDSSKAPLWSVLELSKLKGMSTGIVATCQFPHATPADFVCHYFDREAYDTLSHQFINNSPDVVFTGGYRNILESKLEFRLKDTSKFTFISNYNSFKSLGSLAFRDKPVWGLFNNWQNSNKYLSFDCDRDTTKEPSLSEMAQKAIEILSKNPKGFFLMVEGSQIDWAAHSNDPKAAVTDFIAFDKAVGVCLKYAKSNKNTVVIVCPDHGNGGISIGNTNSNSFYDELKIKDKIIAPLKTAQHSASWVVENLFKNIDSTQETIPAVIAIISFIKKEYYISLYKDEAENIFNTLIFAKNNSLKKDSCLSEIRYFLTGKLSWESYVGWTTHGHTGEDVFLGMYHPYNDRLTGVIDNTDVAKYIARQLGLGILPRRK